MLGSNDFYETITAPSYVAPRGKGPAIYANEHGEFRPRLTLNLGVRWEPFLPGSGRPVAGKIGGQINMPITMPAFIPTRYPNLPAGFLVAGDPGVPTDWRQTMEIARSTLRGWHGMFSETETSVRAGFGV